MSGENGNGPAARDARRLERRQQRQLEAFAQRTYLAALERAALRRRELGIAGRFPTIAVAPALDELELLLAELDRRRPLFAAPRDPNLEPLIVELRALLAAGRHAAGDVADVVEATS